MNDLQRLMLRASAAIHSTLVEAGPSAMRVTLPEAAWDRCCDLNRRIEKAASRGWRHATRQLRDQLQYALAGVRQQIDQVAVQLEAPRHGGLLATQYDLYRDLLALQNEFDEVEVCSKASTVSAVTEEIVLHGVDLGRFEIGLRWDQLGQFQPYSVTALDPNPAASSSDTTHPHVQDDSLCEGDGRVPIRQGLRQGRLSDFFVMVRQILETYNAASAYVNLDQWYGIDCHDCGRFVAGDDRYTCERCDVELCGDCSTGCRACGRSCCDECIASCSDCGEHFCPGCLSQCAGCRQPFCEECLTDEKCTACHEAEESKKDLAEDKAAPPATSVDPVCVGQTPLPA